MSNNRSVYVHADWPEALWDVSGAFVNDRELVSFYDYCKLRLGFTPFSLVHGSPLFGWNSGRVLKQLIRDAAEVRELSMAYVQRKIAIDLTFSNLYLTQENVRDKVGNTLLEFFRRNNPTGQNAVIMASDTLYEHVKTNFPELKTVSSILKVAHERGRGKPDYYRRLAEKYDKVMIHPDDSINCGLLEKLGDKSKYELIVNEYCVRSCPIRHLHYDSLSKTALDFFSFDSSGFDKKLAKNGCSSMSTLLGSPDHGVMALKRSEIKTLYDMGFRRFKLQGRGHPNAALILFDLLRLVLREDEPGENAMQAVKTLFWEMLLPGDA